MRIALSLLHRRERVDVPVRDVVKIEALADETFYFPQLRVSKTYPSAHVTLALKPDVRACLYRLTRDIVWRPARGCRCWRVICRLIVREPLGIQDAFNIGVVDLAEAKEIAAKLREGRVISELCIVSRAWRATTQPIAPLRAGRAK